MTKTLLSLGHGYSARALAGDLIPSGWRIIGTTRSTENAKALRATGIEPLVWPGVDLSAAIAQADHILVSAAPNDAGDPFFNAYRDQIAARAPNLKWFGYLSTTGVYGNHDGAWVHEDAPLTPSSRRGRLRQEAEGAWASIPDLPLHIFRLAGIYGPGRGPFEKVRNGTARRVIKPGQVFSRIHVEDIAQVLAASIAMPDPGTAYNLCDDDPAPPQDVIAYAARLLGVPVPPAIPFEEAEMTPMARSFYNDNKKIGNSRLRDRLGVTLKYPTYRAGLDALLADETGG